MGVLRQPSYQLIDKISSCSLYSYIFHLIIAALHANPARNRFLIVYGLLLAVLQTVQESEGLLVLHELALPAGLACVGLALPVVEGVLVASD